MKPFHVYIHFPFCIRKCPYCDFFSVAPVSTDAYLKYYEYLHKEIGLYGDCFPDGIRTVYFGGGTPSLMDPDAAAAILGRFRLAEDAEVTLEVNPATADYVKLKAFMDAGITRFSIGSQSFIGSELKTLGRLHSANEIYSAFEAARKAGCGNISLDLISGIPGTTAAGALYSASELCGLGPEHVSVYMLTYYEGTPFHSALSSGRLKKPDDDLEMELFSLSAAVLERHGYSRYEISNFCLPGMESKHNQNTWAFGEYAGLGPAAHSFLNGIRGENPSSLQEHYGNIDSGTLPSLTGQTVPEITLKNEFLMLGLRRTAGINTEDYRLKFGKDIISDFPRTGFYIEKGILLYGGEKIRLSPGAFGIFNSVVSDIII